MYVTPDDIAVALGRTAPDAGSAEYQQWQVWISDAQMLIRARLGDLDLLDGDTLKYVIREAVVAHIRNPDDATQVEVAVDDARASRTYRSSKGRVTIISEWWDLLKPSNSPSGAFSIIPTGGTWSAHLPWCSVAFGEPCSCGADIAGEPIFELGGI